MPSLWSFWNRTARALNPSRITLIWCFAPGSVRASEAGGNLRCRSAASVAANSSISFVLNSCVIAMDQALPTFRWLFANTSWLADDRSILQFVASREARLGPFLGHSDHRQPVRGIEYVAFPPI